ncbi:hypothetical protein Tco_1257862, partial [Tanacetum coccineum]
MYNFIQTFKTNKSVQADETVEVPDQEKAIDDEEPAVDEVVNTEEHPQDDVGLNHDRSKWFKQPPRPETLDPEWSKDPNADVGPEQNWFHELEKTAKDQCEFDDMMVSTIDFSNFIKHRVKKDKIIKANLEGQLDWTNHEGDRCPYDLSKPLPLQGPL